MPDVACHLAYASKGAMMTPPRSSPTHLTACQNAAADATLPPRPWHSTALCHRHHRLSPLLPALTRSTHARCEACLSALPAGGTPTGLAYLPCDRCSSPLLLCRNPRLVTVCPVAPRVRSMTAPDGERGLPTAVACTLCDPALLPTVRDHLGALWISCAVKRPWPAMRERPIQTKILTIASWLIHRQ